MKLLVYSDLHFTSHSSIVRGRKGKYSDRLTACINTLNFIEEVAKNESCDKIICCGDFFDKSSLNSEEISALKEVDFNKDVEHILLLGNHEMQDLSGNYNSLNFFVSHSNFTVIDKISTFKYDGKVIHFIPYQYEVNCKIEELIPKKQLKNSIIFSHNDIKGIQYGKIKSESGLDLTSIENSPCDLFINGHLHFGSKLGEKSYNIGNVVGLNFSEDGFKYSHQLFIIDTEDAQNFKVIENPYSFYFYKLHATTQNSNELLEKLKHNAICSVSTSLNDYSIIKKQFESSKKVLYNKFNFNVENQNDETSSSDLNSLLFDTSSIYTMLSDFCIEKLGESKELIEELELICKGL